MDAGIPNVFHHPEAETFRIIGQTTGEGWGLAAKANQIETLFKGTHSHDIAVAPDGAYAHFHWRTLCKEFKCVQLFPPRGRECFGWFEASFPPPLTGPNQLAAYFRAALPVLEESHALWRKAPCLAEEGKPVIYVCGDPARDLQLVSIRNNKPELLAEYAVLLEAIYRVLNNGGASQTDFDIIAAAAASRYQDVWDRAFDFLFELSHYDKTADQAYLQLSRHKLANVRLRAVQSLHSSKLKLDLVRQILASGFMDKNSKVRLFSADRAFSFSMRELLSQFESAITNEPDDKTRESMMMNRSLLKFGVAVRPDGSNYSITVLLRDRNSCSIKSGYFIPRDEFSMASLMQVVQKAGGNHEHAANWTTADILPA